MNRRIICGIFVMFVFSLFFSDYAGGQTAPSDPNAPTAKQTVIVNTPPVDYVLALREQQLVYQEQIIEKKLDSLLAANTMGKYFTRSGQKK